MDLIEKIVSLAKRRGFIFPGSEIYGGLQGFWDYGPLGTELKRNIKQEWWKTMVYDRDDVVGLDAAVIMNPQVWQASGHVDAFTDPLVECKKCHQRFRADQTVGLQCLDNQAHDFTAPKVFNLLTEVYLGVTEPKLKTYLRGEITQGVFVNFKNVVDSSRIKIPFGIAQIGKAFRNEITPGNFTFRSREFEQMELEFFVKPDATEGQKWFDYWAKQRLDWYIDLGIKKDNLRFREHEPEERAHYARAAQDIEYHSPFGWKEFEGIHNRGDWDLSQHQKHSGQDMSYFDQGTNEHYMPFIIETSGGVDRAALFFLIDAYHQEKDPSTHSINSVQANSGQSRIILKLHPKLAPYKVAVFPLLANKGELVKKARQIYSQLTINDKLSPISWDDRGNIGKRYFAQDEIGTPYCITVDFQTLEDNTVTIRDRDTAKQKRVKVSKLSEDLSAKLSI